MKIKSKMVDISYDIESAVIDNAPQENKDITVVYVWADWCLPCRNCGLLYEDLEQEYRMKNITFLKENIEEDGSFHKDLVNVVPTFFIYQNDEQKAVIQGGEFDAIRTELDELLQ